MWEKEITERNKSSFYDFSSGFFFFFFFLFPFFLLPLGFAFFFVFLLFIYIYFLFYASSCCEFLLFCSNNTLYSNETKHIEENICLCCNAIDDRKIMIHVKWKEKLKGKRFFFFYIWLDHQEDCKDKMKRKLYWFEKVFKICNCYAHFMLQCYVSMLQRL